MCQGEAVRSSMKSTETLRCAGLTSCKGPEFAPRSFELRGAFHPRLVDTRGQAVPTVVAVSIDEANRTVLERTEMRECGGSPRHSKSKSWWRSAVTVAADKQRPARAKWHGPRFGRGAKTARRKFLIPSFSSVATNGARWNDGIFEQHTGAQGFFHFAVATKT